MKKQVKTNRNVEIYKNIRWRCPEGGLILAHGFRGFSPSWKEGQSGVSHMVAKEERKRMPVLVGFLLPNPICRDPCRYTQVEHERWR